MKDINQIADELGLAITETPEHIAFVNAKIKYDADENLKALVGEFNLKRMNIIQEMQKPDKDDAAVEKLQQDLRDSYSVIMDNPVMTAYNDAQQAVEAMVNDVYAIINRYVTGGESDGCSGECSSCSGCH